MAERAGSEFHGALKPADSFSLCEQLSDAFREHFFVGQLFVADAIFEQYRLNMRGFEAGARQACAAAIGSWGFSRLTEQLMPDEQGSAQCCAGITRGRLHPDASKGTILLQSGIGDTVQSDAPGHNKIFELRLLMHVTRHVEEQFFSDHLDTGSQIHVALQEWRFRGAGWDAEQTCESPIRHSETVAVLEVFLSQAKAAVTASVQQVLADDVCMDRLAVGCQSHDFVFAAVDFEAEMSGEGGIEQSEGMREPQFSEKFDAIALSPAPAGGGPFTNAIDGEHSSLVEWRGKKRAGGVTLMMFEKAESSVGGIGEVAADDGRHPEFFFEPWGHGGCEAAETEGGERCGSFQQAFEMSQWFFVPDDEIKL